MMYKKKLPFLIFFLSINSLFVSSPDWVVNENEFQHTMTLVAKLNLDGTQLIGPEDKVGAFVGEECRGVSGLTYVQSKNSYYAYLTIFSNTQGEKITFKLYDKAKNKITVVSKSIPFTINEHKGNLTQSYSIAEPALSKVAELVSFHFSQVPSISTVTSGEKIQIAISENFTKSALKPVFTLSKGAKIFEKGIEQKSGEMTKDFSTLVSYVVLSEDESEMKNYQIQVNLISNAALFYKKDAVCSAPGAIKVVSKQEGMAVQLWENGKEVSNKIVSNGMALFPEVGVGTYIASIGNERKVIEIKLKEK